MSRPSRSSRSGSLQHPSSSIQIRHFSLLLRLMPQTPGWEPFSLSDHQQTKNYTPVLSSHAAYPQLSTTTPLETELLAVKLALKEWRHYLEGAEHPFVVWTDHKNLSYITSAKRLNSRQARWASFFGRFNFTLTYHPGS